MSKRVESMYKAIQEAEENGLGYYALFCDEILELIGRVNTRNDLYNLVFDAYAYGFIRGRRCEKVQQKKRRAMA